MLYNCIVSNEFDVSDVEIDIRQWWEEKNIAIKGKNFSGKLHCRSLNGVERKKGPRSCSFHFLVKSSKVKSLRKG